MMQEGASTGIRRRFSTVLGVRREPDTLDPKL